MSDGMLTSLRFGVSCSEKDSLPRGIPFINFLFLREVSAGPADSSSEGTGLAAFRLGFTDFAVSVCPEDFFFPALEAGCGMVDFESGGIIAPDVGACTAEGGAMWDNEDTTSSETNCWAGGEAASVTWSPMDATFRFFGGGEVPVTCMPGGCTKTPLVAGAVAPDSATSRGSASGRGSSVCLSSSPGALSLYPS